MRRLAAAMIVATMPLAAAAQQGGVVAGTGAVLRALEKVSGDTEDFTLAPGDQAEFGRLNITAGECRYPVGDPAGDAYAFVSIREDDVPDPLFSGWMIASSPALNALDHPRYDVWVLRCKTE